MQTRHSFRGSSFALLTGLVLAVVLAGTAPAAPRTVLGELFSSAG